MVSLFFDWICKMLNRFFEEIGLIKKVIIKKYMC